MNSILTSVHSVEMVTIPLDKQLLTATSVGGVLVSISRESGDLLFTREFKGLSQKIRARIDTPLININAFACSEDGLFLSICCHEQIYIVDCSEVIRTFISRQPVQEYLVLPYFS